MSYCANLVQYPPLTFFTACSATQHSCLLPPCQTINKKLPTNIFEVCVIDMRQVGICTFLIVVFFTAGVNVQV